MMNSNSESLATEAAMDLFALRTLAGGIHYTLLYYGRKVISRREWQQLCNYLKISYDTGYCVEVNTRGFLLTTKELSVKFDHSLSESRMIEIVR
jgi:hypothetical protein